MRTTAIMLTALAIIGGVLTGCQDDSPETVSVRDTVACRAELLPECQR